MPPHPPDEARSRILLTSGARGGLASAASPPWQEPTELRPMVAFSGSPLRPRPGQEGAVRLVWKGPWECTQWAWHKG